MSRIPFVNVVDLLPQVLPQAQPPDNVDTANTDIAPYTEYSLNVYYFDQTGKLVMPVAGPPGTPCQILDWSAPIQRKLVLWLATRLGDWPVLPDPAPANSNEVYLEGTPYYAAPMFLPSTSQYKFQVGGYYEYALLVPQPLDQLLNRFAKIPFDLGKYPGINLQSFKKLFPS